MGQRAVDGGADGRAREDLVRRDGETLRSRSPVLGAKKRSVSLQSSDPAPLSLDDMNEVVGAVIPDREARLLFHVASALARCCCISRSASTSA